jgi:hypothetical protein
MRTTFVILLTAGTVICGACSRPQQNPPASGATPGAAPAQPPADQPSPGQPSSGATPADQRQSGPAAAPSGQGAHGDTAATATRVTPAPPPPPPKPTFKEITLPVGTELALRLDTAVASDTSKVEDPVRAELRHDVLREHLTVLPAGTRFAGAVTSVERSGKVKGLASLSFRLTSLTLDDERYDIRTSSVSRVAKSTKGKDAKKIGIGTGAGALIGGLIGGGKGAAVGAGVGAGAGTGVVMSTRGEEVRLASGTPITVTLADPLTVRVRLER